MVLSKQDITYMEECIVSYLDYKIEADEAAHGERALEMFYESNSGFDDAYARQERQEVNIDHSDLILAELLNLAGLEFIDYSDD
ncbi:hypothetical protein [Pedobacter antarcticus]|uniref:hypothetical protein n=1 Tax=Pedobacter antarcticus TaxID=34086 RepID=UPI00115FC998|nr:hypothetical protein [Pedobacter antarcticus]